MQTFTVRAHTFLGRRGLSDWEQVSF